VAIVKIIDVNVIGIKATGIKETGIKVKVIDSGIKLCTSRLAGYQQHLMIQNRMNTSQ
jgi:hypothetical protein